MSVIWCLKFPPRVRGKPWGYPTVKPFSFTLSSENAKEIQVEFSEESEEEVKAQISRSGFTAEELESLDKLAAEARDYPKKKSIISDYQIWREQRND